MNASSTAQLVNLMISTWPIGVRGHVWTETIHPLDFDHAHAAYIALRDTEERPPSVARFMAAYHAQTTADEAPDDCELCDGTGWLAIEGPEAHNPRTCRAKEPDDCYCTGVTACRCTQGQRRAEVQRRIVALNAETMRRIGRER